jgi:hypothetical protein
VVEKDETLERALKNMQVRIREELSRQRQDVGWCEVHETFKAPDETVFFTGGYTPAEKLKIWGIISEHYIQFLKETQGDLRYRVEASCVKVSNVFPLISVEKSTGSLVK